MTAARTCNPGLPYGRGLGTEILAGRGLVSPQHSAVFVSPLFPTSLPVSGAVSAVLPYTALRRGLGARLTWLRPALPGQSPSLQQG